jgi:hypothetical protein
MAPVPVGRIGIELDTSGPVDAGGVNLSRQNVNTVHERAYWY